MLPITFDPTPLADALPDVIAAIGIGFALALVTFKPRPAPTAEEALEAMREVQERMLQEQQHQRQQSQANEGP